MDRHDSRDRDGMDRWGGRPRSRVEEVDNRKLGGRGSWELGTGSSAVRQIARVGQNR